MSSTEISFYCRPDQKCVKEASLRRILDDHIVRIMPAVFDGALLELVIIGLHVLQIGLLTLILDLDIIKLLLALGKEILRIGNVGPLRNDRAGKQTSVHDQQYEKVNGTEIRFFSFKTGSFFHGSSIAQIGAVYKILFEFCSLDKTKIQFTILNDTSLFSFHTEFI